MSDDGLGVRVVEELERRYQFPEGVDVLDGGTSGIELLSYIRNKDHLIIIDAVKTGQQPGTVVMVEGQDVPARFMTRISPHQIGISDLLATATLTGELPKGIVLLGIEPKRVEVGLGLSDEVKAGFSKLIDAILGELRKIGFVLEAVQGGGSVRKSIWEKV